MTEPKNQARGRAGSAFWRDQRARALLFQTVIVVAVVAAGYFLFDNTLRNLETRGINTGFAFLGAQSGFGIIQSLVEYSETSTYATTFLVGLLNTLLVSGIGIFFATLLGFILGVARLSSNWLIAKLATAYVEIFRNIPLLLQIFFWYFAVLRALPGPRQSLDMGGIAFLNLRGLYLPAPLPQPGFGWVPAALLLALALTWLIARWARRRQAASGQPFHTFYTGLALILGLPLLAFVAAGSPLGWEIPELRGFNFRGGITIIPEFSALILALSIYTAAFIAEIVRAGILSVNRGQSEAAHALGLRPGLTLRLVIIPQAMRVIIPPLTSQYLNLTKNSSLATAIGYPDLVSVFAGTTLNQTGQAVEVIAMTMAVYLSISLLISLFMNWYNKRSMMVER
jgi:general L-amino acid transport system permease protein